MMEYREFIEAAGRLDFIADDQTADAVVKAVLGILASGLNHSMAQNLTSVLPDPLNYDRLRGHQGRLLPMDSEGYVKNIAAQFGLQEDQARRAVAVILGKAREAVQNNEITIIIETILHELEAEDLESQGLPPA